jgi:hypothetical protein
MRRDAEALKAAKLKEVATADEKLKALYEEISIAREELQSLKDQQEAADFGDRRIQTLNQPILHTPNVILQRASNVRRI